MLIITKIPMLERDENPDTGDTNGVILLCAMLFVFGAATFIVSEKKKNVKE